jgi:hypothetical protein
MFRAFCVTKRNHQKFAPGQAHPERIHHKIANRVSPNTAGSSSSNSRVRAEWGEALAGHRLSELPGAAGLPRLPRNPVQAEAVRIQFSTSVEASAGALLEAVAVAVRFQPSRGEQLAAPHVKPSRKTP